MGYAVRSYTRNGKPVKAHTRGGGSSKSGIAGRASGGASRNFGARVGQLGGQMRSKDGSRISLSTAQARSDAWHAKKMGKPAGRFGAGSNAKSSSSPMRNPGEKMGTGYGPRGADSLRLGGGRGMSMSTWSKARNNKRLKSSFIAGDKATAASALGKKAFTGRPQGRVRAEARAATLTRKQSSPKQQAFFTKREIGNVKGKSGGSRPFSMTGKDRRSKMSALKDRFTEKQFGTTGMKVPVGRAKKSPSAPTYKILSSGPARHSRRPGESVARSRMASRKK